MNKTTTNNDRWNSDEPFVYFCTDRNDYCYSLWVAVTDIRADEQGRKIRTVDTFKLKADAERCVEAAVAKSTNTTN